MAAIIMGTMGMVIMENTVITGNTDITGITEAGSSPPIFPP